ncbi:MAG: hypothetical protein QRY71_04275 [Candidatus Rhabdochlamydia sp.]
MMQSIGNFFFQAISSFLPPIQPSVDPLQKTPPFGPEEWNHYLGISVPPLPIPDHLTSILQSPCPFWPDKLVEETHITCLIPQGVSALDVLEKLLPPFALRHLSPRLGVPSDKSYWMLITKCIIPNSSSQNPSTQNKLLPPHYRIPHALEAIMAVIAMKWFKNIDIYPKAGERTCCQEIIGQYPIAIGSDPASWVCIPTGPSEGNGIAAVCIPMELQDQKEEKALST